MAGPIQGALSGAVMTAAAIGVGAKKAYENEKQISENYVKFYLTDMNDEAFDGFQGNLIPTFHDFSYISNKPSSKLLFSDSLSKKGEEKKYRLRVWLSDRYVISFDEEWFSVDVDVISK